MTDKPQRRAAAWHPNAVQTARVLEAKSRSAIAPLLYGMYKFRRLRAVVLGLCMRLEGGTMTSDTLRRVMKDYHKITVGRHSYGYGIGPGILPSGTTVGAYCSIGNHLIVRRRDHPIERPYLHPYFYNSALKLLDSDSIPYDIENPLQIGNDVWIGDRVTILSGCKAIGNGAVLAAGSVITKDVPAYAIMGGIPARVIRLRFDAEQITRLEESRWWERDIASLLADPPFDGLASL